MAAFLYKNLLAFAVVVIFLRERVLVRGQEIISDNRGAGHGNSSLKQFIEAVHGSSSWKKFMEAVHGNSSWKQLMETVHGSS